MSTTAFDLPCTPVPGGRRFAALHALGLGLVIACTSLAAHAADLVVTVVEQVQLGVPPARAWDVIKDFMQWSSWHPAFAGARLVKGDGHSTGTVRLLTAKDGAQFTEELTAYDPLAHRLTYRILESPAPVVGYVSSLEVRPGKSGSTVVWRSSFKVKDGTSEEDARKAIAGIYRLGLDNLATSFD